MLFKGPEIPLNLPIPWELESEPPFHSGSLLYTSQYPERCIDRFCRFCRAHERDQQTVIIQTHMML